MTTRPPYVLGIDSALQRTGVAVIQLVGGRCRARTEVLATAPRDTSIPDRHRRIAAVGQGVGALSGSSASLALVEAPALDADHGNAWDRAAVWWWIVGTLLHRDIPVATVAPTTLKKWATGRGGSAKHPVEKADVVRAMHAMWPGVPCTTSDLRHHECESLAMAHMCAQRLGWPVPVRAHHGEPLAVVKWPLAPVGVAR
jgi:crossover junction endodeoxyribonuclease RuvC